MNTHLKNVKLLVKGKPAQQLDSMSIRGSNIRCDSSRACLCCAGSTLAYQCVMFGSLQVLHSPRLPEFGHVAGGPGSAKGQAQEARARRSWRRYLLVSRLFARPSEQIASHDHHTANLYLIC